MLGLLRVHLGLDHVALRPAQVLKAHAGIALQPFQVGAMPPLRLAVILLEFFAARALIFLSRLLTRRSRERMTSMVLFTRSITRLRSKLVKPRLRMMSD